MATGRKLFLTHAGELAHLLVSAISRNAMAMEFVRGYAERYERRKLVANAERLREMESRIGREALLLIAAEVRRLLPRAFGLPRGGRPEDQALCDVFFGEFLEALGRALEWPLAEAEIEAENFRRDLETYARWRERSPTSPAARKSSGGGSPFPDRCAILLDSAMMEQARRAAVEFQSDVLRLGTRIFGQLGRRPRQRRLSRLAGARTAVNRRREGTVRDGNQLSSARKAAKRGNRPRRRR
jgi:hypothetical protein